jgi:exodeoxyribonuclease VII large subunit
VLIVARGGGSLEDLWGFNEEIVARAAAAGQIPLISAVGHETDFTLIDFVSDRRAPTPTAAAELAVPVRTELVALTASHAARLSGCLRRYFDRLKSELRGLARGLPSLDAILSMPRQRLDALGDRLPRALRMNAHQHRVDLTRVGGRLTPASLRARLERLRDRVRSCAQLVEAYSYHKVLNRGFALVRDAAGAPVRAAAAIATGDRLEIEFSDGRIGAVADSGAAARRKPEESGKEGKKSGQGGLFD